MEEVLRELSDTELEAVAGGSTINFNNFDSNQGIQAGVGDFNNTDSNQGNQVGVNFGLVV